ncbi:MAG: leucine-rich repeat protein [Ruminococcus sp.]|nr:leucine-rich repeat protein [Ruminococcus sp.]
MKKRLLSLAMAAVMTFGTSGTLPLASFAEITSISASAESKTSGDWEYYENDDGTIGITGYSGTNTHLNIPQYLDNKRVVSIYGFGEFMKTKRLLSVSIPEGVREIQDYAFEYCSLLGKVELPDSLEYIGEHAFTGCVWLEKITIPDNVNYIGKYAFAFCDRLKEVNIPQSVSAVSNGAFWKCISLEYIEIPDRVTEIGNSAFEDCEKLTTIDISKGVESIGRSAFYNTKWIENKQLNDPLVIVNGILIDGTKCSGNVTMPENIKVADEAFNHCKNVKTITVPLSVKNIGYHAIGFYDGEKLEGFKMRVYAHSDGLYYARAWGNDIEYEIVDPVNALWEGDRYTEDHNEETGEYHEGFAVTGYAGTEKNIVIPSVLGGVTVTAISDSRSDSSFRDHNNITGVTIPNCVKHIKELSFFNSGNLQKVSFGNGIKDIGFGAFSGCEKLSEISLPDSLEKIGGLAFEFCNSLNTVTIPKNVTEIGVAPFSSCFNLKSINVDKNNKNFCSVDGVLYSKDKTKLIECPGKKTSISIPSSVTSISDQAFNSCDELKTITIPKSVKEFGDHSIGYVYKMYFGFQKVDDFLIMCYSGSEAEKYAKDNDFAFVLLDGPKATYSIETLGDSNKNQITAQIGREKTIKIHRAEFDNITYNLFDGVEVDGKTVDPTNYTAKSGSLNLTLKASYLSTLSVGDHTMKVLFKDGEYVSKLTVVKNTQPIRLAGAGRYATAAAISQAAFDKADTVILAYSMNYADALAGVPLAYQKNAPILLTNTKELDSATLAEIKRLGAKKVILLGGEGAIGKEVETALVKGGIAKDNIKRIAGKSRFSTATAIASQLSEKPTDVFFVYYNGFADALSASTVAARKTAPIIYLTTNGEIDADTAKYLKSIKGSVKNAYVIGGEGVISNDMATKAAKALGLSKATRVAGADRFATCVEVNKQFAGDLNGDMICVATGMNFPDALAGGVYAALNKAPLFLINGKAKTPNLNDAQKAYLKGKNAANITAFGGEGVVPDSHIADIAKNSV